jgi:hypothetical protein
MVLNWAYVIIILTLIGPPFGSYFILLVYITWDFWDSYTSWWAFLLSFEWVGGLIVPTNLRYPISKVKFHYGKPVWLIFHVIVVLTIFWAGVKLGLYLERTR